MNAGNVHEHDWHRNLLAGGVLGARCYLDGLFVAASAAQNRLDQMSCEPNDEPEPAHHRDGKRYKVSYRHPGLAHVALT
jgi:hypothetical protein